MLHKYIKICLFVILSITAHIANAHISDTDTFVNNTSLNDGVLIITPIKNEVIHPDISNTLSHKYFRQFTYVTRYSYDRDVSTSAGNPNYRYQNIVNVRTLLNYQGSRSY